MCVEISANVVVCIKSYYTRNKGVRIREKIKEGRPCLNSENGEKNRKSKVQRISSIKSEKLKEKEGKKKKNIIVKLRKTMMSGSCLKDEVGEKVEKKNKQLKYQKSRIDKKRGIILPKT